VKKNEKKGKKSQLWVRICLPPLQIICSEAANVAISISISATDFNRVDHK
jgi:hypothetical protein